MYFIEKHCSQTVKNWNLMIKLVKLYLCLINLTKYQINLSFYFDFLECLNLKINFVQVLISILAWYLKENLSVMIIIYLIKQYHSCDFLLRLYILIFIVFIWVIVHSFFITIQSFEKVILICRLLFFFPLILIQFMRLLISLLIFWFFKIWNAYWLITRSIRTIFLIGFLFFL